MAITETGPQQLQAIFADRRTLLSNQQAVLLNALLGRERIVSQGELCAILWGHDPDGGPLNMRGDIRRVVGEIRSRMARARVPWALINWPGRGYQLRYLDPPTVSHRAAA